MAIAKGFPGLETSIEVDGKGLEEYDVYQEDFREHNGPKLVTKYIVSEPDQKYTIRLTFPTPKIFKSTTGRNKPGVAVRVELDGKKVRNSAYLRSELQSPITMTRAKLNENGRSISANFSFAKIKLAGPSNKPGLSKLNSDAAKDVGSIMIQVFRVHNMTRSSWSHEGIVDTNEAELTEKQLKGESKSHSSALVNKVKTAPNTRWNCWYIDREGDVNIPLATYKFLHGSRKDLKAMYIIPESDSDSDTDTEGEDSDGDEETNINDGAYRQSRARKRHLVPDCNFADLNDIDLAHMSEADMRKFIVQQKLNQQQALANIKQEKINEEEERRHRKERKAMRKTERIRKRGRSSFGSSMSVKDDGDSDIEIILVQPVKKRFTVPNGPVTTIK